MKKNTTLCLESNSKAIVDIYFAERATKKEDSQKLLGLINDHKIISRKIYKHFS